jgi:glycosyltransferase involved in cell wall biosynthesis
MLLESILSSRYSLLHFQIGSEGREENRLQRLTRLIISPFAFGAFLARYNPAIVHINTSLVPQAYWRDLVYLCVAKVFRRKVVSQIHGGAFPAQFAANAVTRFFLRRFIRASDIVTVLSSDELQAYRTFDQCACVEVVPNAVALTRVLTEPRLPAPDASLRLVYVGRIVRTKGLFDVLPALAMLRKEGLMFNFRVAGSGPDEGEFRRTITSLGLDRVVQMLGPVFGEDKDHLWVKSDLFLFPTFHLEGLPYSILESLAAGCVPVTCPVAGIRDVVLDEVHGLFVAPKDPEAVAAAIRRLARNRDELRRMSQAGRRRIAEQYTVARLAARFREIYERVGQ